MVFSSRSAVDRTPNRLTEALEQRRLAGHGWLDLTVSNPTRVGLPHPRETILDALRDPGVLRYEPHPFGLPVAREAVAAELGTDASRIVLTSSTSEAYSFLFRLLCNPGDEVLVPQPSYPLLELLTRFDAVRLRPYRLRYDGRWHIDLGSLREQRTARARALIVVHPNNPTGSYVTAEELEQLLELDLPILSDEVFAAYPLQGLDGAAGSRPSRHVPTLLQAARGVVFVLGGLSKRAALPQLKLGWIGVGGDAQMAAEALARLELIADSFLSVNTPVQLAAPALLRATTAVRDAIRTRTRDNLQTLHRELGTGSAATVLRVEGGWYAVVRLPRTDTEEQWVLRLLDTGVQVQPGWFYDFEEEAYVIVSLLTPPDQLAAGAARIAAAVDAP